MTAAANRWFQCCTYAVTYGVMPTVSGLRSGSLMSVSATMYSFQAAMNAKHHQLWDAQTGHLLAESTGEMTVAAPVLTTDSTVSLDDIAHKLWSRMLKYDLPGSTSESCRCP